MVRRVGPEGTGPEKCPEMGEFRVFFFKKKSRLILAFFFFSRGPVAAGRDGTLFG